jgi:predicted glycosyltransferase
LTVLERDLRLTAVVSDQRFGLWSRTMPSVLITHQVFPMTPFGQALVRHMNRRHLARFQRLWVMDRPEAPGLAGALSHGKLPVHARYIGTLSRLQRSADPPERTFDTVALISGPEPQRSLLETRLKEQLRTIPGEHLLVRGSPLEQRPSQEGNVTLVPHLAADALAAQLSAARFIVTRSGYTTLMDLAALGRCAVLIPTPGQSEQEYLGDLHRGMGTHVVQEQNNIDLHQAFATLGPRATSPVVQENALLERALDELATMLR